MKSVPGMIGSYNINLYLTENLKYDSIISDLSKKELLKKKIYVFQTWEESWLPEQKYWM